MIDARSSGRFKGEVPEPRPSLPSGSMKGSMNLHYSNLLNTELGTLKTKTDLEKGQSLTLIWISLLCHYYSDVLNSEVVKYCSQIMWHLGEVWPVYGGVLIEEFHSTRT